MPQLTLYLDEETERSLRAAAKSSGMSLSAWVADLIRARTATVWPAEVLQLRGAWADFPTAETIRKRSGKDTPREPL